MPTQTVITTDRIKPNVTGSITANGQMISTYLEQFSSVVLSLVATSLVGHSTVFEVSNDATASAGTNTWDGVSGTWYLIQAQRSNTATFETGETSLAATPTYARRVNVSGWKWFRIRVTAHTSGTADYTISHSNSEMSPSTNSVVTLGAGTSLLGFVNVASSSSSTNALSLNAKLASAAASTNATNVKNTAGRIYHIYGYNAAAAVRYLKLYAKASAPTVGTDVPVLTIPLAPSKEFDVQFGSGLGFYLANGIGYALTVNPGDADATAVTAGDVLGMNIIYI